MNDLNENFSGNSVRQSAKRESEYGANARNVSSTNAAEGGEGESRESSGQCQNGVCSLTWKPLRPAA